MNTNTETTIAEKPAKKTAKKPAKKPAKKTAKKKAAKKTAKALAFKASGEGYKGHRKGSIKEKLHQIFDKHKNDPDQARALALKIKDVAPATVTTSFSQFRHAGRKG